MSFLCKSSSSFCFWRHVKVSTCNSAYGQAIYENSIAKHYTHRQTDALTNTHTLRTSGDLFKCCEWRQIRKTEKFSATEKKFAMLVQVVQKRVYWLTLMPAYWFLYANRLRNADIFERLKSFGMGITGIDCYLYEFIPMSPRSEYYAIAYARLQTHSYFILLFFFFSSQKRECCEKV